MVGMIEVSPAPASLQVRRRSNIPLKPDWKTMDEAVSKKSGEIEALAGRIREIKGILEAAKQSRGAVSPELIDAQNQMGVLQSDFDIAKDEKQRLRAELQANDAERSRRSAEARALREKLGRNPSLQRVESQIREIESHRVVGKPGELQELYKQRDLLPGYLALQEEIDRSNQQRQLESDTLKAMDEEVNLLWAALKDQRVKVAALREKKSTGGAAVDALHQEKNEAYLKMKALGEERKKIRDDFQESLREWNIKRELHAERMKKEQDRKHGEWLERKEAQKAREAEFFVEEFTDEILECDQLLAWLNKQGERGSRDDGPVNLNSRVDFPALEGLVALPNKKSNRELESWLVGTKGGKGKNSRVVAPKPQKLSLSVDMLNSFSKLKLQPPLTLGDVSGCIGQVQGKRGEFVKLQAEAKARRERGGGTVADADDGDDEQEEETSPSCSGGPSEDPSSLDASFDDSEEASTESPLAPVQEPEVVPEVEPEVEPEVVVPEVEAEAEPVVTEVTVAGETSPEPVVIEVEAVVTSEAGPVKTCEGEPVVISGAEAVAEAESPAPVVAAGTDADPVGCEIHDKFGSD